MAKKSASVPDRSGRTPVGATMGKPRNGEPAGKRAAPARPGAAKKTASTKAPGRTSVAKNNATEKAPRKNRSAVTAVRRAVSRETTAVAVAPRRARTKTPSPAGTHWVDTLRDGTHVLIRAITKKDEALERAFINRLSPQSRRLRFLGQIGETSSQLIRSLTDLDWRRDAAFIALVHREGEKREIGVSRYSMSADGKSCECAVTVDDEWNGRGLAVILMRHLIELARSRGIATMFSIDAADNQRMRDLARFLGFHRKVDSEDVGQVIHTLLLTGG